MDINGAKSGAKDIVNGIADALSNAVNLSSSPESSRSPDHAQSFHSMHSPTYTASRSRRDTNTGGKSLRPFDTQAIKILLLENVNKAGQDILRAQGYQVEALSSSLPEAELIEKIKYLLPYQSHPRLSLIHISEPTRPY